MKYISISKHPNVEVPPLVEVQNFLRFLVSKHAFYQHFNNITCPIEEIPEVITLKKPFITRASDGSTVEVTTIEKRYLVFTCQDLTEKFNGLIYL